MSSAAHRIAFVTGGLPFGGSTSFLLHLGTGLRNAEIECEVFNLTAHNPMAEEFSHAGVPVHVWDEHRLIFEDRLTRLHTALAQFKPTVVIANIGCDAYEVLRHIPAGVARLGMVHDRTMRPDQLIPAYRDALDHVIVQATHLLEDIRKAAPEIPCSQLPFVTPLPLDHAPRDPNPEAPLKLIYFGRLTEQKGADVFAQLVATLERRSIPFRLTLQGRGEAEEFLRRELAAEIAAGFVTLKPPADRVEFFSGIRRNDVYLLASEFEGGPLTLLEGMALGLVPVCGDIPCLVQEVITTATGFRVPRSDAEAYASAIERLHRDRPLLERMSAAARTEVAGKYELVAMTRRYSDFFAEHWPALAIVEWPKKISVKKPRLAGGAWKFSPALRPFRRLLKRLL